jgi:arabinofuranosyltransferase
MHAELPSDTLITVGAAGAVPYASRLPTIDAFGLVDPVIARMPHPPLRDARSARPGHQLFASPEYIRGRDPDLLCHVGFRGASPPRESDARAPFRTGYVWACVQPGPDTARAPEGGSFDPGVYCCRRPRGRVVGPFGREVDDG